MLQVRILQSTRSKGANGEIQAKSIGVYPMITVPNKGDIIIIREEGKTIGYPVVRAHITAGDSIIDILVEVESIDMGERFEIIG